MLSDEVTGSPIMRVFEVKVKPGSAEELLQNFATTSAEVVRDKPGNLGYFFGRGVGGDDDLVVFTSLWKDLDAIKARFGANWQQSYLPPGYDALIATHDLRHIDLSTGWHIQMDR